MFVVKVSFSLIAPSYLGSKSKIRPFYSLHPNPNPSKIPSQSCTFYAFLITFKITHPPTYPQLTSRPLIVYITTPTYTPNSLTKTI